MIIDTGKRITLTMILLALMISAQPLQCLQRHGEDIGTIPLVISGDEYEKTIKSLYAIVNDTLVANSLLTLLALKIMIESNGSSSIKVLLNTTAKLRNRLLENPNPKINRYDYTRLAIIASIVDYYNRSFIVDPSLFFKLLHSYEEARLEYIIEKIRYRDPKLALLLEEYVDKVLANNTTGLNNTLEKIKDVIHVHVEEGDLDIIPLVVEVLKHGFNEILVIDKIVFAEYVNNTSRLLEEQGYIELAEILRRIASQLYEGFVSKAWKDIELLRQEIIRFNLTLTPELAAKIALILAITSITYKQVYVNLAKTSDTIQVVANILTSRDYALRRKVLEVILTNNIRGEENIIRSREVVDVTSLLVAQTLSEEGFEGNLGLLSLRQPLTTQARGGQVLVEPGQSTGMLLAILISSIALLGVMIYSILGSTEPIRRVEQVLQEYYKPSVKFSDERMKIVEAYINALSILEIKGLGRRSWETPREHLQRIPPTPCREAFERLVEVYEKTVFSDHKIGLDMVGSALKYLEMVREACG